MIRMHGICENMKNKLQCYQNSALRATLKVDISYSSKQLLFDTGFDSSHTDMIKAACKMTYKGFYNLGPENLNAMFCLHVPERSFRSEDELRILVPRCYTFFFWSGKSCSPWKYLLEPASI